MLLFFFSSALHIYLPIRQFFYDIIHPEYSPVCDVYAIMFLIDVVNFIVTIYGYWAFGVSGPNFHHENTHNYTHNKPDLCSEILCSGRHHRVSVRRPGSRSLPSYAAHPVWHHDCGPGPLSEEILAGKVCFPGGTGVWDTLLDVLYPSWCHREVFKRILPIM